jgi:hypothetical protein
MKKLITIFGFTLFVFASYAQSVGIGTNTPNASAQLDVTSTSKGLLIPRMTTAQRTAIAAPANGLMVYDTNLSAFYFYNGSSWNAVNSGGGGSNNWAANGNNIYNSNTGSVGIGSATGIKEKLSVKGNLFVTHTNPNDIVNGGSNATINIHPATAGYARINFLNRDTTVGAYITYSRLSSMVNQFSFNHGSNTNQLSLDDNGNVGIGKIGTEKLDVNGNIRSRQDVIVDNDVSVARNIKIEGSTTSTGNIRTDGRVDAEGVIQTRGGLSAVGGATLYVTGTALLESNITGNGSASIAGNINSNTSMSITDAAAILDLKSNSTTSKAFVQLSGDDLRVGTYSDNNNGGFIVRTNGANRMIVNNVGNVGIGTATPGSTLHVQGRGLFRGAGEVITVDGTSNPNIGFYNNGAFRSFISQTPNSLVVGVNGGPLQLDAPQVAIGAVVAAASGYRLTVAGKAICEELKVQLQGAWPDYVFQDNYGLMPLADLKNYISANNHLPNIPAAATMQKEGLEVGEMQRKMMEKIEELTLYVIALEEKISHIAKK